MFDLRTVLMLTFALFYTSTQTSTGPTDNYIQLWHGDVKLPQQSLEAVQRTDRCHPPTVPISPDLAGSQPSRQAPPRWIGHKLRFAFRWYSALLKRCSADKAHAGRNAFRTSALLRPKISGRKSPKERFVQRKLHKTTPVCRKSGLEPERKPELGMSISICCRIGQPGAETCR